MTDCDKRGELGRSQCEVIPRWQFVMSFYARVFLVVTQCDRGGGGSKNVQFCVTSFMNHSTLKHCV